MLGLAWIISRYAKRIHAAGALYDYVERGLRQADRPARRLGLLRRRADAHARHRPGLRRLHRAACSRPSTASTSTGSGSRSRSGSSPGRSRCSACGSRRARSSSSLSSRSPSCSPGRSTWSSRAAATASRCGRSTRASRRSRASPTASSTPGLIFVGLRVGGQPGRGDGPAEAQHPARHLLQRGRGGRLLRRAGVGAAAGLRPRPGRAASRTSRRSTPRPATPTSAATTFGEFVQWLVVIDIAAVGLGTATSHDARHLRAGARRHLPKPLAAVHPQLQDAVHRGVGRRRSPPSSSR